ncbi:MAG: hypothetical protein GXP55_25545 [Deltaproteobacteria bacterium]|nr:hypothetical protein [Deltaproteobacteria bacterium]
MRSHSTRGWTASTRFCDLLDLSPALEQELAPFIPGFEFILEDLTHRESDELHDMATTAVARLALFCLKEVRDGAGFVDALPEWADIYHEVMASLNGVEAMAAIMRYIHLVTELPRPELERHMLTALGPEAKEAFVTLGEQLIEQGRREGLKKGVLLGRQEGRQDGQRRLLQGQLEARFGPLPAQAEARLDAGSERDLERWARRVLDAEQLEQVFEG